MANKRLQATLYSAPDPWLYRKKMKILEDIILEDSIEIKSKPEVVFNFITSLVDNESYCKWHPKDHISLQWIKGNPWEEDSVVVAKEYVHGVKHTFKFIVTSVKENQLIEYKPKSKFLRIFIPLNSFNFDSTPDGCVFTARGSYRIGRLGKLFAKKFIDKGIESMKLHLKEEGQNLKKIIETGNL